MFRFLLFVILLMLALSLPAQPDLRLVTASSYTPIHNLDEADDFECHGCCRGNSATRLSSSSTLRAQGAHQYEVAGLADNSLETAWIEGNKGDGIGEYIRFDLPFDRAFEQAAEGAYHYPNAFYIANGYQKHHQAFWHNSRVKRLKMYVNDIAFCYIDLLDTAGIQLAKTGLMEYLGLDKGVVSIKLEIVSVYPGKKYRDTAISELFW